ncbi:hypothetical protein BVRB_3g049460 [Beta vulgaris subsp. vulgaris]|nr:hypothetical protein BVRB_3g049460 [Beta vulgaris subsp. vulgaris]
MFNKKTQLTIDKFHDIFSFSRGNCSDRQASGPVR